MREIPAQKRLVYMDHSATTPTHPDVLDAMLPFYSQQFGNPSSLYSIARTSREAVALARSRVAAALGADAREIFFTAGGTESDNWALKGVAFAHRDRGNHIITTAIEHHAILHTCGYLEQQGFEVTYLPVNNEGLVNPSDIEDAITDSTILISVMTANNEIGTIEPIEEIGRIAASHDIYFHTDAVQAIGYVPIDVKTMHIDLLSLSAHKFYGPKGVGALYIRDGVNIDNFIHGGAQEKRRRAGTENLPGVVGLGVAIERICTDIPGHCTRIRSMRDMLLEGIMKEVDGVQLNGHPTRRLPGNINVSFSGIDGEALLLMLDHYGICASTGSACSSGSDTPSHVLLAIGRPPASARGSLRLTLGDINCQEDIEYVVDVLPPVIDQLREMSPLSV